MKEWAKTPGQEHSGQVAQPEQEPKAHLIYSGKEVKVAKVEKW